MGIEIYSQTKRKGISTHMAHTIYQLHEKVVAMPRLQLARTVRFRHVIADYIMRRSERMVRKRNSNTEKIRILHQYIARRIGGYDFTRRQDAEPLFYDQQARQGKDHILLQKEAFIARLKYVGYSPQELFDSLAEASCEWTGLVRTAIYELKTTVKKNKVEYDLVFKSSKVHHLKFDPQVQDDVVKSAKTMRFDSFHIGTLSRSQHERMYTDPKVLQSFLEDKGLIVTSLFQRDSYLIHNKLGLPSNTPYDHIDKALLATTGTGICFTLGTPILGKESRPLGIILGASDERERAINESLLETLEHFSRLSSVLWFQEKLDDHDNELKLEKAFNAVVNSIKGTRETEIEILNEGTMRILLNVIAARDKFNPIHSERVYDFVMDIAQYIDLSPKEREALKQCILHDVGKIAIPDKVLNKSSTLVGREYDIIKTHAREGYDSVKDVPIYWMAALFALLHHENYAWSGYENIKMKNEWIEDGIRVNLLVSIVHVADVFDTITSDRPYKKAQSLDYALKELFLGCYSSMHPVPVLAAFQAIKTFLLGKEASDVQQKKYRIEDRAQLLLSLDWYIAILSRIATHYPILKVLDAFTDKELPDPSQRYAALAKLKGRFISLLMMLQRDLDAPVDQRKLSHVMREWGNTLSRRLNDKRDEPLRP